MSSFMCNYLLIHLLDDLYLTLEYTTDSASRDTGPQAPIEESEIIFLGTGTSEGIPRVSCLTNPLKKCTVCSKAAEPGNKNKRLNTSILISYANSTGRSNILVDAGKFFYHSALRWFPVFGLRTIDAVVITHSHADAIGGLDDLRDWTNNIQPSIPIYTAKRDFEVMKKTHYYLVDTSVIIPGAAVSELQFNIIQEEPFTVNNLKFIPLPVWHGSGYRSLGFRFGNVCYISDVSDIPEETYLLMKDCDILIMDALRPDQSSSTHFGLPKSRVHIPGVASFKSKMLRGRPTTKEPTLAQDVARISDKLDKLVEAFGKGVFFHPPNHLLDVPIRRFEESEEWGCDDSFRSNDEPTSEIEEEFVMEVKTCDVEEIGVQPKANGLATVTTDQPRGSRLETTPEYKQQGLPTLTSVPTVALEEVRKIQPKRTLFTGMMHLMDHDIVNEELSKLMESEGLDVQLSYDGLSVPVRL
ncbi:hypothetical protein GIB67_041617 [Kingdonia uniflora]|uniref:Metallo-beta-lactamase domain-containing protein n=1 Tax=Kingdonia uniflora TaxID=39325 RepID=A0A7J7MQJ7_9MAGN|nr:hypothetical protein GIB67_041617 [Kingdonia uniflora]